MGMRESLQQKREMFVFTTAKSLLAPLLLETLENVLCIINFLLSSSASFLW